MPLRAIRRTSHTSRAAFRGAGGRGTRAPRRRRPCASAGDGRAIVVGRGGALCGALLLCIALLPLWTPHWWESNRNKALVVLLLAVPLAAYLLYAWGDAGRFELQEKAKEYASFIVLLGALFVVSGGVFVGGSLAGTPLANTGLMALGAVAANVFGTTGALMLLVRPLLPNEPRQRKVHIVVFFIFIVSNCGGLLTPLGDPPLFLGFLKGVPFEWTLGLWRPWLFVNGVLLVVFHVWDEVALNREERERPGSQLEEVLRHEPLRVQGWHNFFFLAGIVATIYAAGRGLGNGGNAWPFGVQEAILLALAAAAYFSTRNEYRESNRFAWAPMVEVAVLFAGVFATMAPALQILNAWGRGCATCSAWNWLSTGRGSSFGSPADCRAFSITHPRI